MATWKKVAAVTTVSAMTLQLTACGTEQAVMEETAEEIVQIDPTNNVTTNAPASDEDLQAIEDSEFYEACEEWAEHEDGSYTCEDQASSYHGQHYFGGLMYATMGAMLASSYYKSKARKQEQSTGSSSGGGYGGGSRSNSSTTNGATTTSPSTTNGTKTTPPSTTNGASTPSTNTTDSNQNTNKPSNGTTNYSSGKSGFSSGGTSRGGSSSS